MKLRVSTTTIDSYLYYLQGGISFEELVKRFAKLEPASDKMVYGSAVHKYLETGSTPAGFIIDELTKIELDRLRAEHIAMALEVKTTIDFKVHDHEITLVGVADVLTPDTVKDYKCTFMPVTDKTIFAKKVSCQWKFYLELFNREYFEFILLHMAAPTKKQILKMYSKPFVLPLPRPHDNSKSCDLLLHEFVEFIEYNNLFKYFPEKKNEPQ